MTPERLIIMAVPALIVGLLLALRIKKKRNKDELFEAEKRKDTKNRLRGLSKIYQNTPVIKRYFRKLTKKYQSLFPADEITIALKATKQMTKSLLIALIALIAVIFFSKLDIPYTIIGIVGAYIIFTMLINNANEKLEINLLDQLDTFITDIHAYYHDSHNVEDAIMQTIDTLPYEIGLHADKILNIVTSPESDLEMEKYIKTSPNRFLLLLATICNSIKEYGDKQLINGKSLFLTNLNYLKGELNAERIRLVKRKNAFSGMQVGVLIPLFILKPAEGLLLNSIEGLDQFYAGFGGILSLAIVTTITLICYELINILKDAGDEDEDEHLITTKLSNIPFIKKFLTLKINKNYSKSLRTTDTLKATGDTAGLPAFYLRQILWGVGFFTIAICVVLFSNHRSKQYILTNFENAYGEELVPSEEYREDLQRLSLTLNGEIVDFENADEEIHKFLAENNYTDDMADALIKELSLRHEQYKTYYYKWYYLVIALVCGVIGYCIPYWMLAYKGKVRKLKREDEVAQFRTIILILMHEDGMMIDIILEWMERFAHAFKASISECIMNLEYSQIDALETMKETESGFAPFRRLCDSLIAVDKVGMEGAFDDLETEREYYQERRREDSDKIIKDNASTASLLMKIPVYAVIGAYIIVPMVKYVLNTLVEFTSIVSF